MKQTAVEQLQEYLTISLGPDRMRMLANEFEKAKAMEKEQIENAFNYAQIELGMEANEYYEQFFKSE